MSDMATTAAAVLPPAEAAPDPHAAAARRVFLGRSSTPSPARRSGSSWWPPQKDGGVYFRRYNIDKETLIAVAGGFLVFWIAWGWLWYRFKRFLLRKVAGLTKEEMVPVFDSRMRGRPFDLKGLLARHSERRIRIVDMIARRGRTVPGALTGFFFSTPASPGTPSPTPSPGASRTTSSAPSSMSGSSSSRITPAASWAASHTAPIRG